MSRRKDTQKRSGEQLGKRPDRYAQYTHRNNLLRNLGLGCYGDYLNSNLWKIIRRRVLERDKHKCRGCGADAWMVHHRDYEKDTLLGKRIDSLSAICGPCHKAIEFVGDTKTTVKQANELLEQLARSHMLPSPKPASRQDANKRPSRRKPVSIPVLPRLPSLGPGPDEIAYRKKMRRAKSMKPGVARSAAIGDLIRQKAAKPRMAPVPKLVREPVDLAFQQRLDAARKMPRRNPEQEAARTFALDQLHRERLAKTRILA